MGLHDADRLWLAGHGYHPDPFDLCSLDCTETGYAKTHHGRTIILCLRHARHLERQRYRGSYRAALTPADSIATEWPWTVDEPVDVVTPVLAGNA